MSLAVRPNHHTSGGWRRIPIAVPKQDPAKTSLVEAGAYIVAILVFWAAVLRIDFHADEAIYLSSIPVGIGNDAGLVYHLIYLLGSWGTPTPVAGRMTSLVLGVLLIVFVTRSFQCWFPQRRGFFRRR